MIRKLLSLSFSIVLMAITFGWLGESNRAHSADVGDLVDILGSFKTGVGGDLNLDGNLDHKDVFLLALEWKLRFTKIVETSPADGEGGVAITRETILYFDRPLDATTVNEDSIYATFAGQKRTARRHLSPDRKVVTLFYEETLPPSALVRVTVDGDSLEDDRGLGVDADGDRGEGGKGDFDFSTLTLSTIPGTAVFGRVFASELSTAKGTTQEINVPLEGVRITVDGMEDDWFATTDNMGNFTLDPAPAGRFFVHIDGRTVQSASIDGVVTNTTFPDGPYYPFVGKAWQSVPGESASIGNVFLPLVREGALQPVSETSDTTIGLPASITSASPEFAGISIMVPAGSLFADDGTRGGRVGLGVVPPDRLPGKLPPELAFPVVITVQTSGMAENDPLPTNFDIPAPVCFPNLPNPLTGEPLPPNSESALFSFNHDKGFFEVVGSMTVSADGSLICTDPGVGILAPGWHASTPGTTGTGGETGGDDDDDDDDSTGGGDDDDDSTGGGDDDDDSTGGDDDDDDTCKGVDCGGGGGGDDDDDSSGDDDDDDDDDDGGGGGGGGCSIPDCESFEVLEPVLDLFVNERITFETSFPSCATGVFMWDVFRGGSNPSSGTGPEFTTVFTQSATATVVATYQDETRGMCEHSIRVFINEREIPCELRNVRVVGGQGTGIIQISVDHTDGRLEWDVPVGTELPPSAGFDYAFKLCEPGTYSGRVSLQPPNDEPPCREDFEFDITEEDVCDAVAIIPALAEANTYNFRLAGNVGTSELVDIVWEVRGPNGAQANPPRPPETSPFQANFQTSLCAPGTWTISASGRRIDCARRRCEFPSIQVTVPEEGGCLIPDISSFTDPEDDNQYFFFVEAVFPPGRVYWEIWDKDCIRFRSFDAVDHNVLFDQHLDPAREPYRITATLTTEDCGIRCTSTDLIRLSEDLLLGCQNFPTASPKIERSVDLIETSPSAPQTKGRPVSGLFYFAVIDLDRGGVIRRGIGGSNGVVHTNLILGPNTHYEEYILRAETLDIGYVTYLSPSSGGRFTIPDFTLVPDTSPDFDGDGLREIAEMILGTDSDDPDTDGDGILDGDEVRQGLDPLDGIFVRTGIVATADTPGTAVDVCSVNEVSIVADSDRGISVFNIFNGMDPTIIAQVDTPGDARRVACSGDLVAVADCQSGLVVIDISDPPVAEIVYEKEFGGSCAQALVVAGDVAYVGFEGGLLAAVDLPSGETLDFLPLDGPVVDLFIEQDNLYALTESTFLVLDYLSGKLELGASRNSPIVNGNNRRLFVGGGIAYAIHGTGYNTFDVSDPSNPVLIHAGTSGQFGGWRHMALNGSGLGIGAVGQGSNTGNVGVYDVSSATNTNDFRFGFSTPGGAKSVSIFKGLAYVADGNSGIQVVNYLATDIMNSSPGITLSANFPLDPAEAEGGSIARVTADVTDDIQVSHVEFYIDGELAETDGSFPFEHRFTTPLFSLRFTFALRAKVVDTGGNETWSDEITVNVLEDTTRPKVVFVQPVGGQEEVDTVLARFTEPIDPETVNLKRFFVRQLNDGAGLPLKGLGDIVPGGTLSFPEGANTIILSFAAPLEKGHYEMGIVNSVADLSGNRLKNTFHSPFFVGDAVFWTRLGRGEWELGANWSSFNVPGASDTAIASLPVEATIVIDSGDNVVASFYTDHRVDMIDFGSELTVNGPFQLNNVLRMRSGATLTNAVVTMGPEGLIQTLLGGGANFDGLTINGNVEPLRSLAVTVRNNLTLNGRIQLRGSTGSTAHFMAFRDTSQILDGTGVVQFLVDPSSSSIGASGTGLSFTVGPEITIQGPGQGSVQLGVGGRMMGMVDASAGRIRLRGEDWINEGFLHAHGVGEVWLDDTWMNAGSILLEETGTLVLDGEFVPSDLGNFTRNGGTVELSGTVDAGTEPLVLDASTGSWAMFGGTIKDGVVETREGTRLNISTPGASGFFDNATVNGRVTLGSGNRGNGAQVFNGLTLNGLLTLAGAGGSTASFVRFQDASNTLDGTGTVQFLSSPSASFIGAFSPDSLVVGPEITVQGPGQGVVELGVGGRMMGTVGPSAGSLRLSGEDWINEGLLHAHGVGEVWLDDTWTNAGEIILEETGTLELGGAFVPSDLGNFTRNGGTVELSGIVDLASEDLVLDDNLGTWEIFGTNNSGGTLLNGIVHLLGGNRIIGRGGRLDNITLNGDLFIGVGEFIRVLNDITLNGRMTAIERSTLTFRSSGGSVIDGTGEIFLIGGNQFRPQVTLQTDGETFTIGPNITLFGGNARILGSPPDRLLNRGTIHTDRPNFLDMSVDWTNDGLVKVSGGGNLLINGDVWVNSGRIEMATDSMIETNPNFNTDFTQSATGVLALDIAGTGEADIGEFIAGGPVNLDGTLEINLLNGFEPNVGDTFVIMTYPSRNGTFATEDFSDPGVGKDFVLTYGATEVTLEVVAE